MREARVNSARSERNSVTEVPPLSTVLACALPALLLAIGCLLPFVNKAFLIDDPYFLAMARQILKHPIHPMDFDICSAYWYAPLNGAKLYVPGTSEPKPGDLLVVGIREDHGKTLPHFPKRRFLAEVSHKYRFGRTMFAGKGLCSNSYGYWLWGFGESDDDRFELWEIE
jgi:hypothetical protein